MSICPNSLVLGQAGQALPGGAGALGKGRSWSRGAGQQGEVFRGAALPVRVACPLLHSVCRSSGPWVSLYLGALTFARPSGQCELCSASTPGTSACAISVFSLLEPREPCPTAAAIFISPLERAEVQVSQRHRATREDGVGSRLPLEAADTGGISLCHPETNPEPHPTSLQGWNSPGFIGLAYGGMAKERHSFPSKCLSDGRWIHVILTCQRVPGRQRPRVHCGDRRGGKKDECILGPCPSPAGDPFQMLPRSRAVAALMDSKH